MVGTHGELPPSELVSRARALERLRVNAQVDALARFDALNLLNFLLFRWWWLPSDPKICR